MNLNNLVTKLRELIKENTTIKQIYSPDLPQEKENICCITTITSENIEAICKTLYNKFGFRILIRGSENDKETRMLADEIYNYINRLENVTFDGGKLIIAIASPPIYAFRDENNKIHYNISVNITVGWEE